MNKSKTLITAGAVFLSAALAVNLLNTEPKAPEQASVKTTEKPIPFLSPEQVLTWDCETSEFKPEIIMIMCADGGIYVENIKWSTWSKDGAKGTGVFSENLCDPSCAEGKRVAAPVVLTLSNLTEHKGKYYLRTLDISTANGKDFPWGRANGFQWDVMEFAEMMESF